MNHKRVILIQLELWDTGERALNKFDHILPTCKQSTHGVMFVFSYIDRWRAVPFTYTHTHCSTGYWIFASCWKRKLSRVACLVMRNTLRFTLSAYTWCKYSTLYMYYILWHECNNSCLLPGNVSVASLQVITINNLPTGYIYALIFCPPKYKLRKSRSV